MIGRFTRAKCNGVPLPADLLLTSMIAVQFGAQVRNHLSPLKKKKESIPTHESLFHFVLSPSSLSFSFCIQHNTANTLAWLIGTLSLPTESHHALHIRSEAQQTLSLSSPSNRLVLDRANQSFYLGMCMQEISRLCKFWSFSSSTLFCLTVQCAK